MKGREPLSEPDAYKVWGIDNIIYGPVDLKTLRQWAAEQRVTPEAWIFVEKNDAWCKAGDLSVLSRNFKKGDSVKEMVVEDSEKPTPGALRRIKIMAGLSSEHLAVLAPLIETQSARPYATVMRQGDPADAFYIIFEGELRVRLLIGDKETLLATLSTGDCFGEMALFDNGPRSADVVANTNAVLGRIAASRVHDLARDHPEVAVPLLWSISRILAARIRADNKRYRDSITFARLTHS